MLAPVDKTFIETLEEHTEMLSRAGFIKIRYRSTSYPALGSPMQLGPNIGTETEKFQWAAHGEDQNLTYLLLITKVIKAKAIRKLTTKRK